MNVRSWAKKGYILLFGALFFSALFQAEWPVVIVAIVMLAPVIALELRKGYEAGADDVDDADANQRPEEAAGNVG